VEDAAQSVNATYRDEYSGTHGDFGCFSFHETKNFICGEGGALVVRDPSLFERAESIRDNGTNRRSFMQGEVDRYEWTDQGSSYLLPELLAAFLYAQLENMDRITERRGQIFHRYLAGLGPLEERGDLRLPVIPNDCATNFHMFYILLPDEPVRAALIEHLKSRGIYSVFHYVSLHASPVGQKLGYRQGMLPVTEDTSDRLLRLPMYYDLLDEQIDDVVEAIHEFFGSKDGPVRGKRSG
jgi:dTDP-4-amino-4,6-dideoxygalactose transaminase